VNVIPHGLSGNAFAKLLQKAGFSIKHKKGNHVALRRSEPLATLVVVENQTLDTVTLETLLDDACITTEDYIKLLQRK
jgi:predicted RNA binding protein YcfA (HicA-like mRNA interferase family)